MKKILTMCLLAMMSIVAYGQAPQAASCTAKIETTGDDEGVVTLTVTPNAGWHIYGFDIPKGGPKAMKIDFTESTGIELIGKPTVSQQAEKHFDKSFDMEVSYWSKPVVIKQRFKLSGASSGTIKGYLQYQGCNDETCAPPKKFKFSFGVN